ncbi:hypothetical protein LSAC_00783, partial [Levilinea saccharolytica]
MKPAWILIAICLCACLAACGPDPQSLPATETAIAARIYATLTASAPTITPEA